MARPEDVVRKLESLGHKLEQFVSSAYGSSWSPSPTIETITSIKDSLREIGEQVDRAITRLEQTEQRFSGMFELETMRAPGPGEAPYRQAQMVTQVVKELADVTRELAEVVSARA